MRIVSVVVTYNRLSSLKKTIKNTLTEPFERIVVINNLSTDGTKEWLDNLNDDRIIIVHLDKNIGGAGGFRIGFEYAVYQLNADWILCYDDDAYPEAGIIDQFVKEVGTDEADAYASAVYLPNGNISDMNRPFWSPYRKNMTAIKNLAKGKFIQSLPDAYYYNDTTVSIDSASFVGLFINKRVFRTMGIWPRDELFIYSDDSIFTSEITRKGGVIKFSPLLRFIHDSSTLESKIFNPIWKNYYAYRNGLEWLRCESKFWFWALLPIKTILWLSRIRYAKNPKLYLSVLRLSVIDVVRRRFNRAHSSIIKNYNV